MSHLERLGEQVLPLSNERCQANCAPSVSEAASRVAEERTPDALQKARVHSLAKGSSDSLSNRSLVFLSRLSALRRLQNSSR